MRAGASHWITTHQPAIPGRHEAIYVNGRCYWTTSEGWREIRVAGEGTSPGLGFLAPVIDPFSNQEWSIEACGTAAESTPRFILAHRWYEREETLQVHVDDAGRVLKLVAVRTAVADDDGEPLIPAEEETFKLYDFGVKVSIPEPPDAEVLELPA